MTISPFVYNRPIRLNDREATTLPSLKAAKTPREAVLANFSTLTSYANSVRESKFSLPACITVLRSPSFHVRLIVTSENFFAIVYNESTKYHVIDDQKQELDLLVKTKKMSLGEFFLRASYGASKPGNPLLGFFDSSDETALMLVKKAEDFGFAFRCSISQVGRATNELLFAEVFLQSVARHDLDTLRFYLDYEFDAELLDQGVHIASRNKDEAALLLLGSIALSEAAEEGDLQRLLSLIIMGVPQEADSKALELAQKNNHQRVTDFFETLNRLTNLKI